MTKPTDWDRYYDHNNSASRLTRKITGVKIGTIISNLVSVDANWRPRRIVEIGGANSCFYDYMKQKFQPVQYLVIDNNSRGLDLLTDRVGDDGILKTRNEDVLEMIPINTSADLVYSVGLIEHFDEGETRRVIERHFEMTRSGGYCIITFPTPTLLYRIARRVAESMNLWLFWDERPLNFDEVVGTVNKHANVLQTAVNWPIVFTQGIVVAKRR